MFLRFLLAISACLLASNLAFGATLPGKGRVLTDAQAHAAADTLFDRYGLQISKDEAWKLQRWYGLVRINDDELQGIVGIERTGTDRFWTWDMMGAVTFHRDPAGGWIADQVRISFNLGSTVYVRVE
jgi:hypothetical protein